jgi:hypothetical protein
MKIGSDGEFYVQRWDFFFFLQGCLSVKSVSTSWFAGAQAQQDGDGQRVLLIN